MRCRKFPESPLEEKIDSFLQPVTVNHAERQGPITADPPTRRNITRSAKVLNESIQQVRSSSLLEISPSCFAQLVFCGVAQALFGGDSSSEFQEHSFPPNNCSEAELLSHATQAVNFRCARVNLGAERSENSVPTSEASFRSYSSCSPLISTDFPLNFSVHISI